MKRSSMLLSSVVAVVASALGTGCTSIRSYWQQHYRPQYTITPDFYASPPTRIAVLPLTPMARSADRGKSLKLGADACRKAFYRYISVKEYEDIQLKKVDRLLRDRGWLAGDAEEPAPKRSTLGSLDMFGLTSVLDPRNSQVGDWLGLATRNAIGEKAFEKKPLEAVGQCTGADTVVRGNNKEYSWFYAVLFSYVRVHADYEMYRADSGRLLWSGCGGKTSFQWILSGSYLELPFQLIAIWLNARGEKLERTTDDITRALARHIPDLPGPVRVTVRATSGGTPVFTRNTYAFWRKKGSVPAGTQMRFLLERNGWFQVQTALRGKEVTGWVFRADAELVDEEGNVLRPRLTASDVYLAN